jgi:hypothetical protein
MAGDRKGRREGIKISQGTPYSLSAVKSILEITA